MRGARIDYTFKTPPAKLTSHLVPRTSYLEYYAPMQLVVPSVVRIAVMMLARICKSVFTPSFFIVVLILRLKFHFDFSLAQPFMQQPFMQA